MSAINGMYPHSDGDDYSSYDHAVHLVERCGKQIGEKIIDDLSGWPVNLTDEQLRRVAENTAKYLREEIERAWSPKSV